MKHVVCSLVLTAVVWVVPQTGDGQPLRGFATFSLNSDVNDQVFLGTSGGLLMDVAHSWVSVGAEGDLFVAWPYFAGRFGPIAQVSLVRHPRARVFGIGGFSWGEQSGPMFGGGIELWTHGRVGFRASVQDYIARIEGFDCAFYGLDQGYCDAHFRGGRSYRGHQPSVQVGITWRGRR